MELFSRSPTAPLASTPQRSQARPVTLPSGRRLILHADDFGMSLPVNRGIIAGFSDGLLTSTSVLANAPGFEDAIEDWKNLARRQAQEELPSTNARSRLGDRSLPFDFGVHLNLTQGRPLTGNRFPAKLLDREGRFPGVFPLLSRLAVIGWRYRLAIRDELSAQIERVLDAGLRPTHLNGHQYVEMLPVVADLVPDLLSRYAIGAVRVAWEPFLTRTTLVQQLRPAEWSLAQVKRLFAFEFLLRIRRFPVLHARRYFGTAHAGRIDEPVLASFIHSAGPGLTEIGIHPGELPRPNDPTAVDGWTDPLVSRRPEELAILKSPALVELLSNQQIDLGRLGQSGSTGVRRAAA